MRAPTVTILVGDALKRVRELPDRSVHAVVTSVPYWGLRDYSRCACIMNSSKLLPDPSCRVCGGGGSIESVALAQIGLESTVEAWVAGLVCIFEEVRRVLRDDGTLWLNVGDSYAGNGGAKTDHQGQLPPENPAYAKWNRDWSGLKPKDLVGQPWRLAFALQAVGWTLRKDIIWAKRNVMPESVQDRPTSSHEYIFLFTKGERYFYDSEAAKEQANPEEVGRRIREAKQNLDTVYALKRDAPHGQHPPSAGGSARAARSRQMLAMLGTRNLRSVWWFANSPYPEAHFATFPEEVPERCILASTSPRGACAECGAQWRRLTRKEWDRPVSIRKVKQAVWNKDSKGVGKAGRKGGLNSGEFPTGVRVVTVGWEPTCECNGKLVKRRITKLAYADWAEPGYAAAAGLSSSQRKARSVEAREVERAEVVYESDLPLEQHPVMPTVVLDPFAGSGTTGAVARRLGRSSILVELNPQYAELAVKRTSAHTRALELEVDA
jgi:DNA modification methylase